MAEFIKQLGDGSFKVREAAQKKLLEIGPPALNQVAKAVKSEDAEVSRRAEEILKVISKQAARRNDEAIKKNLLWKVRLAKPVSGTMRVSGGVACLGCDDSRVRAVDVKTGKAVWSLHTGGDGWTVCGDTVYVPDFNRNLRALDIRSGKGRDGFRSQTVFGEPAVRGGKIYVGGLGTELWVVDARTGKRLNTFKVSGPVDFAPILRGEKLYFLTRGGKAHALNLKTGKIEWSASVAKRSLNALASDGERVYVRADDRLLALEAATGKSLWALPIPADPSATELNLVFGAGGLVKDKEAIFVEDRPLAVAGGAVCLAAGSKILAVDAAKGTKLWEHSPSAKKGNGPGAANANGVQVIVAGQVKVMIVANVGAGRQVIHRSISSDPEALTPPVVAGDVMYFGSKHGLHAVDLKTRGPLWTYRTKAPVTLRPVVADGVIYFVTTSSPLLVGAGMPGQPGRLNIRLRGKASTSMLHALKLKLPRAGRAGR